MKKYILALAILGLAAPSSATAGLKLKHAFNYAAQGISKIAQSRFACGMLTGFFLRYLSTLKSSNMIDCDRKLAAVSALNDPRHLERIINQHAAQPPTPQARQLTETRIRKKARDEYNEADKLVMRETRPLKILGQVTLLGVLAYRDIKGLFTPGQRCPKGYSGAVIGAFIFDLLL